MHRLDDLTDKWSGIHFQRDQPMKASVMKAIISTRIVEFTDCFPRIHGQVNELHANRRLEAKDTVESGEMNGACEWSVVMEPSKGQVDSGTDGRSASGSRTVTNCGHASPQKHAVVSPREQHGQRPCGMPDPKH